MAAISAPLSTPSTVMPSSAQTWRVTSSLSPVMIFTATPLAASASSATLALAFGGSRKAANPANTSSLSSPTTASTKVPGSRFQAMASTRNPSWPSWPNNACACSCAASSKGCRPEASGLPGWLPPDSYWVHRRNTSSGAPLSTSKRSPPRSTSTDTRRRSKSNGTSSILAQLETSMCSCAKIASSIGLFRPLSKKLLRYASSSTRWLGTPCGSTCRSSRIFASVSVPVLSVHKISIAPMS